MIGGDSESGELKGGDTTDGVGEESTMVLEKRTRQEVKPLEEILKESQGLGRRLRRVRQDLG